jgi:hypothetical protein
VSSSSKSKKGTYKWPAASSVLIQIACVQQQGDPDPFKSQQLRKLMDVLYLFIKHRIRVNCERAKLAIIGSQNDH